MKMTIRPRAFAYLFGSALLGTVVSATAAPPFHEGLWRYTMKMDMPGMSMPGMSEADLAKLPPEIRAKMPQVSGHGMTMNFEHCLTEKDMVPHQEHGKERCEITKMDRHGGTVEWSSVCETPRGKMTATGTATYSGDTMTSTTHMTGTDDHGKPIDMTQNMTGQYAGACPTK